MPNVARGLVVNEAVVRRRLVQELPFMATEEILMAGVRTGGDRQALHERVRRHSLAAAEQVKQHGRPNDLIERLRGDAAFAKVNLDEVLDPRRHIGRAPQQVEAFVGDVIEPIRQRYAGEIGRAAELKV